VDSKKGQLNKTDISDVPLKQGPTKPMTPLAASATIVNLLLATGPFSYP